MTKIRQLIWFIVITLVMIGRQNAFHVRQPPYTDPKIVIHCNPCRCLQHTYELASNYAFSAINHEDYLCWRTIVLGMKENAIHHVREPLANCRIHSNSLTSNKFLSFVWLCKVYNFAGVRRLYSIFLAFNILFRLYRLIYSRSLSITLDSH